jgi:hypothetical protein
VYASQAPRMAVPMNAEIRSRVLKELRNPGAGVTVLPGARPAFVVSFDIRFTTGRKVY